MADLSSLQGKQVLKFSVYHPERCEELCAPYFTPAWRDKVTLAVAGKEWMDSTPPEGEKKKYSCRIYSETVRNFSGGNLYIRR